jgi:hypothetical protein
MVLAGDIDDDLAARVLDVKQLGSSKTISAGVLIKRRSLVPVSCRNCGLPSTRMSIAGA